MVGARSGSSNDSNSEIRLHHTGNHTYRIAIENSSAQVVVLLNTSLFAHPFQGNKLGFASVGRLSGTRIITVEFGPRYAGAAGLGAFIANPLHGFSIAGKTQLRFSFLDGSTPSGETG